MEMITQKTNNIWVEITSNSHEHGGRGWEYGKYLWSPTTNTIGHKIYEIMKEPLKDDLVLHFYEKGNTRYLDGYSYIQNTCEIIDTQPPKAKHWSGRESYYKIKLKGFTLFESPKKISDFLIFFKEEVTSLVENKPKFFPFNKLLNIPEGKYLTRCNQKLFEYLVDFNGMLIDKDNLKEKENTIEFEYKEGIRKSKEIKFFTRNPKLVKEAKLRANYSCEACGFVFSKKYGEYGKNYVECHHENTLSESDETKWNEGIKTTLDQVKVLCSNCHRMIHHKRPAITFEELIEILKDD